MICLTLTHWWQLRASLQQRVHTQTKRDDELLRKYPNAHLWQGWIFWPCKAFHLTSGPQACENCTWPQQQATGMGLLPVQVHPDCSTQQGQGKAAPFPGPVVETPQCLWLCLQSGGSVSAGQIRVLLKETASCALPMSPATLLAPRDVPPVCCLVFLSSWLVFSSLYAITPQ